MKKAPAKAAPVSNNNPDAKLPSTTGRQRQGRSLQASSVPWSAELTTAWPGGPLLLDLDRIDEDPKQPRRADSPGFADDSIAELASTIAVHGVKSPISVRANPDAPGRYVVNHGARRLRASRVASCSVIPAFIDNAYTEVDQVIENLHRNELTAREIADFIGRELAKGLQKKEIATQIGKSAAFASQHAVLLDLPTPIADAFLSARVHDVTVVNELVRAYKSAPQVVAAWLLDQHQDITRGSVRILREFLSDRERRPPPVEPDALDTQDLSSQDHRIADQPGSIAARKRSKPTIEVAYRTRHAWLLVNRPATDTNQAWIHFIDDDTEQEVPIHRLKLIAIVAV